MAAAAIGTIGAVEKADADFIPPYSLNPPPNGTYTGVAANGVFGNWTSSGANADDFLTTNGPASLTLHLQNLIIGSGPETLNFTVPIVFSGTLTFDWNYTEFLFASNASEFGYTVNGTFTSLATSPTQTGMATLTVATGDIFGFRLIATYGGSQTTVISNFSAPIPEPSISMLAITGAVGLMVLRAVRLRRRS